MLVAGFHTHCHEFLVFSLLRILSEEPNTCPSSNYPIYLRFASNEQFIKPAYLYGFQQGISRSLQPNALQT